MMSGELTARIMFAGRSSSMSAQIVAWVRDALASGKLSETSVLKPRVILRIPEIGLEHAIDGEIGMS